MTEEELNKILLEKGFEVPLQNPFIPGEHCCGEKPFGSSKRCYKICLGTHGIKTAHGIKRPCEEVL